jgi:hypothetical protein
MIHHIDFATGKLVPLINSDRFPVGQVLTYEDMANPLKRYVVTSDTPGDYGQPLTCEDGHTSRCAPSSIGRGGWRDTGETLTPDQLADFLAAAKQRQAREAIEAKAAAEAEATDRATRRAAALKAHPYLKTVQPGEHASAKLGAANIRLQLKRTFPGIKFSVTSDVYSGGDSISVRWSMGPTTKEVEAITAKYQEGHFNGMEDIYENDNSNVWCELFGGAKYVSETREDGEAYATIAGHLCDIFKIERPANGHFWNLRADEDDKINGTTRGLMSCTSFPPGAVITGIEHLPDGQENDDIGYGRTGLARYYRVLFTHPAAKITPAQVEIVRPEWDKMKDFLGLPPDDEQAPAAIPAAAVTITENTEKQGIEIRFPAKPPAFLLDSLKALGWRWSRAGCCWYAKASAEARTFAQNIAAQMQASKA